MGMGRRYPRRREQCLRIVARSADVEHARPCYATQEAGTQVGLGVVDGEFALVHPDYPPNYNDNVELTSLDEVYHGTAVAGVLRQIGTIRRV